MECGSASRILFSGSQFGVPRRLRIRNPHETSCRAKTVSDYPAYFGSDMKRGEVARGC